MWPFSYTDTGLSGKRMQYHLPPTRQPVIARMRSINSAVSAMERIKDLDPGLAAMLSIDGDGVVSIAEFACDKAYAWACGFFAAW